MKYIFDEIIDRRGTNSYKWDLVKEEDVIPMWVADMDFQTAPAIIEALQKRVAHGIFGYTLEPDSYYIGRSTCHFLLPEGHLHAWRTSAGADSCI